MDGTFRSWCFTLNNWTMEEYDIIESWGPLARYMVVGKEVGEEGTPHLQGAITWQKPRRFSAMRKAMPRAHWAPIKAKAREAFDYCKKDNDYLEVGKYTGQGNRSDMDAVYDALEDGTPLAELMPMRLSYTALRTYELASAYFKPEPHPRKVFWYYGKTGSGKTREAKEAGAHIMTKVGNFWSHYGGQKVVCFDDLRPSQLSRTQLLRLCDRYEFQVNIKNGAPWARFDTVYITTCFSPERFWEKMADPDEEDSVDQLVRRILEGGGDVKRFEKFDD